VEFFNTIAQLEPPVARSRIGSSPPKAAIPVDTKFDMTKQPVTNWTNRAGQVLVH
jgi:hypothetical protein